MTHRATLVLYKSPYTEERLAKVAPSASLRDIIKERNRAYRENLKTIINSIPGAIPYVWEGLKDPSLPPGLHPEDFAKYWPDQGIILPPKLQDSDIPQTIKRILRAFLPPRDISLSSTTTKPFEGGTIVKSNNLFFYAKYVLTSSPDGNAFGFKQVSYPTTNEYTAIPIDTRELGSEPIFLGIPSHIDRMMAPPIQQKSGDYLIFSINELQPQIRPKLMSNYTRGKIFAVPTALLYIGEFLNIPVLTSKEGGDRNVDYFFVNPMFARMLLLNNKTPEEIVLNTPDFFSFALGLDKLVSEIQEWLIEAQVLERILSSPRQLLYVDAELADIKAKYAANIQRITGPLSKGERGEIEDWWTQNVSSNQRLIILPYTLPTLLSITSGDKCNTAFWPLEEAGAPQQPELKFEL